jgi:hypothetical protein
LELFDKTQERHVAYNLEIIYGYTAKLVQRGKFVDEKLKRLTQELGQAIDQAINEAPRVKELTEKLRQAGYETILMVEATICFAKRPTTDQDKKQEEMDAAERDLSELMNQDDLQFLKKLKISVEDMDV